MKTKRPREKLKISSKTFSKITIKKLRKMTLTWTKKKES